LPSPSTQHEDLWTDLCGQDQSTVVPGSHLALQTYIQHRAQIHLQELF